MVSRVLVNGFLMVLSSLGHAASSAAGVGFSGPKTYPVGTKPVAAAVGDFNRDNNQDIAVVNYGSSDVSILLGNGNGAFQAAVNYSVGANPVAIAVADLNLDGKPDLVVVFSGDVSTGKLGGVSVLLGTGDGTFQAAKNISNAFPGSVAVGDFNGDGRPDLALLNAHDPSAANGRTVSILLGNGDGTFQPKGALPVSATSVVAATSIGASDFNGDGRQDLAVGRVSCLIRCVSDISVFLGHGDGTFDSALIGPGGSILAVADINGDGKPDLVVAAGLFSTLALLGNGDGTFHLSAIFNREIPAAVGDLDGDGKLDLVTVPRGLPPSVLPPSVRLHLGNGDGTFQAGLDYVVDSSPGSIAAADFNGDKLPDLAVVLAGQNSISVMLNRTGSSGADLSVDFFGGGPGLQDIGYTVYANNRGPQEASSVSLTNTLPANATFVSATPSSGSCASAGPVTCDLGSMPAGSIASVAIEIRPNASGTFTDSASIPAGAADPDSGNNSARQSVTVQLLTMTVAKAGSGSGRVADSNSPTVIDCGSTCSTNLIVNNSTSFSLFAQPDPGSLFQGWSGDCTGTWSCDLQLDGNKFVAATFVPGFTLTVNLAGSGSGAVSSNPAGIDCPAGPCSAGYSTGTAVTLTASSRPGSVFTGWSGACSGTDPNVCNVTLNSEQSVTATFNPPPDFALTPATTNLSLRRGGQVSDTLTFSAQGAFSGTITLACSVAGPSPMPTCGISRASVKPGDTALLTVNAAALAAAVAPPLPFERATGLYATMLPLGMLGCVLAVSFDRKRRRLWALCLLMLVATILPTACGGGSGAPPPPTVQNYTVTVTATSDAIQHSTAISVTVQ